MAKAAVARKPIVSVPAHSYAIASIDVFAIAPENPRTIRRQEDTNGLASNIAEHGVLEPVIVYEEGGEFLITVGGTRFLAAQKVGIKDLPYSCLPKDAAIAAGIAEQEGRTELHPADQARAYAAVLSRLNGEGPLVRDAAVEMIAKRVGKTARFVAQRLALAGLHPPILAALGADEISVKQAEAWANAEVERQQQLWEDKSYHDADPDDIKRAVDKADLADADRLVKFVGRDAYKAAGGGIRQDLFEVEMDVWERDKGVTRFDRKLVQQLAREKIAKAKEKIEAEGWGEVKTTLGISHSGYSEKAKPKTKEERAKYRAEISIDDKGKLVTVRGLRIKTKEAAEKSSGGKANAGESYQVREKKRKAHQLVCGVAEQIVARSIPNVPGLALACMAAAVARALLHELGNDELIMLDLGYSQTGVNVGLSTDNDLKIERAYWLKRLKPHAAKLEAHFMQATGEDVDRLFGYALTRLINLNEYGQDAVDKESRQQLLEISRLAEVDASDLLQHATPKSKALVDSPLVRELVGVPLPASKAIATDDICKLHPPAKAKAAKKSAKAKK